MSRAIERRCAGGRPGRGTCAWRPLFLPIWTIDLRDQFCAQPPARCSEAAVEHDEEFTGAGLYESRRGCSADDLDSETTEKPCGWDLGEPDQLDGLGVIRKDHAVFSYGPEHLPGTLTSGDERIQRGHGTDRYHPCFVGFWLNVENPRASSSAWRAGELLALGLFASDGGAMSCGVLGRLRNTRP
jgi:hypothetical protein